MTFRTFLLKIIRTNIQKYSLFLLSTVFSMSILFVFTNLWFTDGFQDNSFGPMHDLMIIAAIITVFFSIFIISYVHYFLMRERSKSFAILLSYGLTLKDLRRLIIRETGLIYLTSLILSFITGAVFSKLFFMISTKLLMIENITYQLKPESFLVTSIVFAVIFICVLIIGLLRISRKDLIELSKQKNTMDIKLKGYAPLGFLGLFLIMSSMIVLFLFTRKNSVNYSHLVLGTTFSCLIGTYLFISHFSRLLYMRLTKNPTYYSHHILEASEFVMEYRQNRKTLFILTLLTFGIILFTGVTYTLYRGAYDVTVRDNPHDMYLMQSKALEVITRQDIDTLLFDSEAESYNTVALDYIYMKVPDLKTTEWQTIKKVPIVSEVVMNTCFGTNYQIEPGSIIQILLITDMESELLSLKDYVTLRSDENEYRLLVSDVIKDKILNRYLFTQPMIFLVDEQDFSQYQSKTSAIEQGTLYMLGFEHWEDNESLCQSIIDKVVEGYSQLNENQKAIYHELIERYSYYHLNINSRISDYERTKQQGAFSLFIMGFLSILFAFCIFVTLYFKVFMSSLGDVERFKKLDGIGLLRKEKVSLITNRIRMMVFIPSLLGVILSVGWCYSLNFKQQIDIVLSNAYVLKNALFSGVIYLTVVLLYYHLLKRSYLRRLRL